VGVAEQKIYYQVDVERHVTFFTGCTEFLLGWPDSSACVNATIAEKSFMFCCCTSFYWTFNFPDRAAPSPWWKSIRGWVLRKARKNGSDISPIHLLIFTGAWKVRNLASIFDPSRLWAAIASKRRNFSKI